MKVLHVISNLGQGGAEGVLTQLITASPPEFEHVVVSLRGEAYYGPRLRTAGVTVHILNMPRGKVTVSGLLKLRHIVADAEPDVVQTWMYHADLVGGLIARWAGVRSVVWGIRHSNLAADKTSFSARAVAKVCAVLSRWVPTAIVSCSAYAARVHQEIGYQAKKFAVIPNGYDLDRFRRDDAARAQLRADWGVGESETLLGMVARWDPQKDHENLLRALADLVANRVDFRCVLVGTGMDESNAPLAELLKHLNLQGKVALVGPRADIHAVMNALDLHVLSSAGEAFPNAVAEAMACCTPCVVTDVGDAALIVGGVGWVVPPGDSAALARGIAEALAVLRNRGRTAVGENCRLRIEANFSLKRMLESYSELWSEVQEKGRRSK